MNTLLATLEAFHSQTISVIDRVDAKCAEANAQLAALEDRLARATLRIQASQGSNRALVVRDARSLGGRKTVPLRFAQRGLGEDLLSTVGGAVPLPEQDNADGTVVTPSAANAKQGLSKVANCISLAAPVPAARKARPTDDRLLAPEGRLVSVAELFLCNSAEQLYKGRKEINNLAAPFEEAKPVAKAAPEKPRQAQPAPGNLALVEDEPERSAEDIRFRPKRAGEVTFNLPDVLPDLGPVASNLIWKERDPTAGDVDRPAWDTPSPSALSRPASSAGNAESTRRQVQRASTIAVSSPQAVSIRRPSTMPVPAAPPSPAGAQAPPSPAAAPPAPPAPQAPPPAPAAAKPATAAPPPPPPAAGKGKGKGKGKGGPPPPPKSGKPAPAGGAPPPPPPKKAAAGGGMDKVFGDICSGGFKLKKAPPPKERCGALMGRVV